MSNNKPHRGGFPVLFSFSSICRARAAVAGAHPERITRPHPEERGPFQQQHLIVSSPADSSSTPGL